MQKELLIFEFGVDGGEASVFRMPDNSVVERGSSGGILDEEEYPVTKWEKAFESWEEWWKQFVIQHGKNWIGFYPLFIHEDLKTFIASKVSNYNKPNDHERQIDNWKHAVKHYPETRS